MSSAFARVVIAAGLDPRVITPHIMRHTAVAQLLTAGVDPLTVMSISGHKSLAIVMRYYHAINPHGKAAMDKLEAQYAKAE